MKLDELRQSNKHYELSAVKNSALLAFYTVWGYWLFLCYRRTLKQKKANAVVMWSGLMWHQQLCHAAAIEIQLPCLFIENGFLPNTTAIDKKGANFKNSIPRESEFYKNLHISPDNTLPERLIARKPHKNKAQNGLQGHKLPDKYILVPFQVDTDRQIICYSPWIQNMPDFYEILVKASPHLPEDYFFLVKEHPSCKKEYSRLHNKHDKIIFANDENTQSLIENARAVLTINSSVGLESLLLNKYVITTGEAFYNIPGIVDTANNIQELQQLLKQVPAQNQPRKLTKAFLHYLYHHYLVKGDWREANPDHLTNASLRIQELLHEP